MPTVNEIVQGVSTAFKAQYPTIAADLVLPDGLPGDEDFPIFIEGVEPHPTIDQGTGNPLVIGTFGVAIYAAMPAPGYTYLHNLTSDIGAFVHRNSFSLNARPAMFQGIAYPQVDIEQESYAIGIVRWQQTFTLENADHDFSRPGPQYRVTLDPNFQPPIRGIVIGTYIQDDQVYTRTYRPA